MAPTPDWNPGFIKPLQDAWPKIAPVHKTYMNTLRGLGSIFGFASAIALIVSHKFQPPKWPFTSELWNPKPTAEKKAEEKEKEVTEEELIEDELAAAAGGLIAKRSMAIERNSAAEEVLYRALFKRDTIDEATDGGEKLLNDTGKVGEKLGDEPGKVTDEVGKLGEPVVEEAKELKDKPKIFGEEIGEEAKSAWGHVEDEAKEIVESAKEVAEEIWNDISGIFGGHKENGKDGRKKNEDVVANNGTAQETSAPATAVKRQRRAIKFVY